jgi:hypothetical protein
MVLNKLSGMHSPARRAGDPFSRHLLRDRAMSHGNQPLRVCPEFPGRSFDCRIGVGRFDTTDPLSLVSAL